MVRNARWIAANGDVILLNQFAPYILDTLYPGIPSARAEVQGGVRTDGQDTLYVTREPITPSIKGSIHGSGASYNDAQIDLELNKERLMSAFDPKRFGVLIYNKPSGSFRLPCRPIAGPQTLSRIGNSYEFDVELISDEPYWTYAWPESTLVGAVTKMWRFPWSIPFEKGHVFGTLLSNGIIINPTQEDLYPKIFITDTISEKVTLGNSTTGETLTINQRIERGKTLIFDMAEPSVMLVSVDGEEDVTHWITHDSTFPWRVIPGNNEIYSNVDDPDASPIISVLWYRPKVGI
jgi:hypothetical protein